MVARARAHKAERRRPHEMTEAELEAMREREAQHYLAISATEFARRWQAGEYEGVDSTGVLALALLFRFV